MELLFAYRPRRRFAVLACTLAAYLFVLAPLSRQRVGDQSVAPLLLSAVLAAGVYACSHHPRALAGSAALALLAAALTWISSLAGVHGLAPLASLLMALFVVFVLAVVTAEVIKAREVTGDTILGAVAVYLMLAMVWAMLYVMLAALDPKAFHLPPTDAAVTGAPKIGAETAVFVYYSFVTLTTMGYGDILPVSDAARGLAACEAVTGQIYLAVLVSRLVGLHIAGRR